MPNVLTRLHKLEQSLATRFLYAQIQVSMTLFDFTVESTVGLICCTVSTLNISKDMPQQTVCGRFQSHNSR